MPMKTMKTRRFGLIKTPEDFILISNNFYNFCSIFQMESMSMNEEQKVNSFDSFAAGKIVENRMGFCS